MDIPFSMSEILDSLLNSVLVIDTDLNLHYMNHAAEEMIGHSFSHMQGRSIRSILSGSQFDKHIAQAFSSHQRQVARSGKIRVRGSHKINIDCTVTPLFQHDIMTGILFELSQVDRQIRIARETQLISTQAANQSLLRGIAHEIKNPLGGLRGAAQLLELQYNDASIKEYTNVIITEADRLSKLVDSMLVSHQSVEKTQLNIHEVFEHVRQLTITKLPDNIQLKRDYDPSIPDINGNFDQLVQTALNLLNNAITSIET
jgi:two-component system nitrogen regulation sensor histidine kinase GlnL